MPISTMHTAILDYVLNVLYNSKLTFHQVFHLYFLPVQKVLQNHLFILSSIDANVYHACMT